MAESEKKEWCDTELSSNEQIRKEKTALVQTLHASIDELTASVAMLTQEIADLQGELESLAQELSNRTALREDEKVKNAEIVRDAKESQNAVAQALAILEDFYAHA